MNSAKLSLTLGLVTLWAMVGVSFPEEKHLEKKSVDPAVLCSFRDVTKDSGINFTYRNGEEADHLAPLEAIGGGIALLDYDGDGLLDIFFVGGGYFDGPGKKEIKGYPNRLFKNLGNWKFRDVTKEVGLDNPRFYSHGVAVADIDNDGWPDILVTGYGGVTLYHNVPGENGKRKFVDITWEAGLGLTNFWATSAAFGDLDGDGFPDLYICRLADWSWDNHKKYTVFLREKQEWFQDILLPKSFPGGPHAIFRNNGKGGFENWSTKAGITFKDQKGNLSKGLGVVIADLNGDRKPDIFVTSNSPSNYLYFNLSKKGKLHFDNDGGMKSNTDWAADGPRFNGSRGAAIGDYFGSGLPSILATNGMGEDLTIHYKKNLSRTSFKTKTLPDNKDHWGGSFFDPNNEGREYILVANGSFGRHPLPPDSTKQQPTIYYHKAKGGFDIISDKCGSYFGRKHRGRALVVADLDNDGFPDIVISHLNEPAVLLKNMGKALGNSWLGVELVAKNRADLCGSKVMFEGKNGKLTHFVYGGGYYLSSGPTNRHIFGLGKTKETGTLWVEWANGEPKKEFWNSLSLNQYHRLTQGKGTVHRGDKWSADFK